MKDSKFWVVSTMVLFLVVIGLSSYITFDKLFVDDNIVENKVEDNNIESDIENNISWVDYLNQQQFVSASLSVCQIDGKYVYGKDVDMQPNPGFSRNITQEELKQLLNGVYQSNKDNNPYGEIVKSYGYSAPACTDEIVYNYIHNGKEYQFLLADGTIIVTEDNDFLNLLESNVDSYPNYSLNQDNTNYYNLVKDMMKDYVKDYKN